MKAAVMTAWMSRGARWMVTTRTASDAVATAATAMGVASGAFLSGAYPRGQHGPCLRSPVLAAASLRPSWAVEKTVAVSASRVHLASVAAVAVGAAAAAMVAVGGLLVVVAAQTGTAVPL